MTVERKTAAEWEEGIRAAILEYTREYDTAYGPVVDLVLKVGKALEELNNERLRPVSLLAALENSDEFSESDLDAVARNEDIERPEGSPPSTTLTFTRASDFGSENGVISRGTPVGSSVDDSTGQPITYVTSESRDKTYAVKEYDQAYGTFVWKVRVPAISTSVGSASRVGANRVNRPLRPLTGYDSVTNETDASNGSDRYTNDELIDLLRLAVSARQLAVAQGVEFYLRGAFSDIEDAYQVGGTDQGLNESRANDDAGAVDIFIKGEDLLTATENFTFWGVGQLLEISTPPLVDIVSVESGGTVYEEDVDFEAVFDDTGYSGSTRAHDGIRFIAGGAAPTAGATVTVTFTYNNLVRAAQADLDDPLNEVDGRDELVRQGEAVDIYISATLTPRPRFNPSTIKTAAENLILNLINVEYGLKTNDVELSDIQGAVRRLSGVDNFVLTRLSSSASDATVNDPIELETRQYPRLLAANMVITLA